MSIVKEAKVLWKYLNGIICVYKPANVSCEMVRLNIINKICFGLNEMQCRPPMKHVVIEGEPSEHLEVIIQPNFADDVLVVGPRYIPDDVPCSWSNYLGKSVSGVLLLGIRDGTKKAKYIRENLPLRSYKVTGKLGIITDNLKTTGKVVERTTWKHIKLHNIEAVISSMQAAHQRKMFELEGVDIQSQTAYEMAVNSPLRPTNSKVPVIYGIKCVDFQPPYFTLEIQSINENEMYLRTIIFEIGTKLKSSATCENIRCIRHACFTVDHALLRKHWSLQNIVDNLKTCSDLLNENKSVLLQRSSALV